MQLKSHKLQPQPGRCHTADRLELLLCTSMQCSIYVLDTLWMRRTHGACIHPCIHTLTHAHTPKLLQCPLQDVQRGVSPGGVSSSGPAVGFTAAFDTRMSSWPNSCSQHSSSHQHAVSRQHLTAATSTPCHFGLKQVPHGAVCESL